MEITDPIADMLTRIRNANMAYHPKVDIPASKLKQEIARILRDEGYIKNYKFIEDRKQGILRIYLKYGPSKERIIGGLMRVSKPGRRVFVKANEVSRGLRGLGKAILSTSKGVLTDKECREMRVGGELLCYVW
ncbi:TPA: 30S ribosomal protein S8 [bacterium]|nr:30S ribosomal protein S8 [bacterium]